MTKKKEIDIYVIKDVRTAFALIKDTVDLDEKNSESYMDLTWSIYTLNKLKRDFSLAEILDILGIDESEFEKYMKKATKMPKK